MPSLSMLYSVRVGDDDFFSVESCRNLFGLAANCFVADGLYTSGCLKYNHMHLDLKVSFSIIV